MSRNPDALSRSICSVKHCAEYLGVSTTFYRNNLLPLDNHPTPINPKAKNLTWWSSEVKEWLDDPKNCKAQPSAA